MTSRRPLRIALFCIEIPRTVAVAAVFSALAATASRGPGGLLGTPPAAFAAPQALFPIAALFMALDSARYGAYAPLYAAGKAVSAAATGAWLLAAAPDALTAAAIGDLRSAAVAATGAFVALYDALSAALAAFLLAPAAGGPAGAAPASDPAADQAAPVVDAEVVPAEEA